MAETFSNLSVISFVISGCSLVAAVVVWILFKIPNVIGDLSGKNAQKSIAKMRATNEKSGKKTYKSSDTNIDRGKLTVTMSGISPGNNKPVKSTAVHDSETMPETSLLETNKAIDVSGATELLDNSDGTVLLDETLETAAKAIKRTEIELIEEVMLIHTDEVI